MSLVEYRTDSDDQKAVASSRVKRSDGRVSDGHLRPGKVARTTPLNGEDVTDEEASQKEFGVLETLQEEESSKIKLSSESVMTLRVSFWH